MKEKNLKYESGIWMIDIEIKGRRLRRNYQTKSEAQAALAVLKNQRAMDRIGIEVPEVKNGDILFGEFTKKVIAGRGELRKNTQKGLRSSLNIILRARQFKDKRLREITTEDIAIYHTERGVKTKAAANADLSFLKMIFRRAVEWGELARNPAAPVKPFRLPQTKLRILSDEEAALLLQAARPILASFLQVLLTTGMRPHEVFALHWEYDGWETEKKLRTSIVSIDKKQIFIPGLLSKNHKDRVVPLSPELTGMFNEMRRKSKKSKVFPWSEEPKAFAETVRASGLKNVTLYTLKHTAASRMIRAGVDIVTVSEILGHSDIQMTIRYCHSDAQAKREAVEKISRIYFQSPKVADASPRPSIQQNHNIWAGPL